MAKRLLSSAKELPQAVVTDLMMPGMNGMSLSGLANGAASGGVMMTGQATVETAVQAIKLGAYDYLTKPLEPEKLRAVLERGLKQVALAREAGALRQKLESPLGSYGGLIGKSPPMREFYQQLSQIAATDATVLVNGESGTGKELVNTLHDLSPRREETFSR
jgi:DNA-binding NtrC family response regulator